MSESEVRERYAEEICAMAGMTGVDLCSNILARYRDEVLEEGIQAIRAEEASGRVLIRKATVILRDLKASK